MKFEAYVLLNLPSINGGQRHKIVFITSIEHHIPELLSIIQDRISICDNHPEIDIVQQTDYSNQTVPAGALYKILCAKLARRSDPQC